jgi:hypothetical protein
MEIGIKTQGFAMYMLVTILVSLIAWCPCAQASVYARPATKTTFIGSVGFPNQCKSSRCLTAYYKGCKVDITQRSYTIKDRIDHDEFYYLFTLDPIHPESHTKDVPNTFRHFKMPASNTYACYKVSKNPVYWNARFSPQYARSMGPEKAKDAWHIQNVTLPVEQDKKVIHLPEHTIIFLISPSFVDRLETEDWDTEMNTTKIPKVVLKNVSEKEFNTMVNHAAMLTSDLDVFHRKPTVIKEAHPNSPIIVSIVTD